MATINIVGNVIITDVNGAIRQIPLNNSVNYSYDNSQTFNITAGSTTVIYNTADSAVPISPWSVLILLPSLALDLSMGNGPKPLDSTAAWNSIPLAANQVFVLDRNVFWTNYVNGSATNIFGGTGSKNNQKLSVYEPSGSGVGTIQVFMAM